MSILPAASFALVFIKAFIFVYSVFADNGLEVPSVILCLSILIGTAACLYTFLRSSTVIPCNPLAFLLNCKANALTKVEVTSLTFTLSGKLVPSVKERTAPARGMACFVLKLPLFLVSAT